MNLLEFTAVTFPAGYIDKTLDPGVAQFAPLSKEDEAIHALCMSSAARFVRVLDLTCPDDGAAFHGAPIGLQLMCQRTEEEKALKLVEIILQAQAQSSALFG